MNFHQFNFHPSIMAGIEALGFEEPTPIQEQAIPPVLEGRDIIGLAQTGTGKTAAFVLPILQKLVEGPRGSIRALVVSPTRELAEQTCDVFNTLGKKTGLKAVPIYGGVSMFDQKNRLPSADIIVACPGRLLDHLWGGTIRLNSLELLVIDEADRMFDMGFLPDIRNILSCIMQEHQTLLFSATMPTGIRKLTQEFLTRPVNIQIGLSAPARTISHALYPVPPHLKTALLKHYLANTETDSVLVFTRTKHRAERLGEQLRRAGLRVTSLQGDLPQHRRQVAIDSFRSGSVKILVATDIAARGIDILSISHVINYDMPESPDDYIHRIGRTGRIDNTGEALTFVSRADDNKIHALEKILKQPLERRTMAGFDYDQPDPDGARPQPGRKPAPVRAEEKPAAQPRRPRRPHHHRPKRSTPAASH
jgi:ATP-dependent RNA helicase RhlE